MEQKNPIVAAIEAIGEAICKRDEEIQLLKLRLDNSEMKAKRFESELNAEKAENERLTRKLNEVKDYIKAQEEA